MRVSTKGRYALRMMVDLAMTQDTGYISLRDVSERQEISMKYLEQIVSSLTHAGMLSSIRGPQGGYRLVKPPAEYTVGEILRVTEGSLAPLNCVENGSSPCVRAKSCPVLPFWEGLYQHILSYMDSKTLEDLVAQVAGL